MKPKPDIKLMRKHSLPRVYKLDARRMVIEVLPEAHEAMKKLCAEWGVSLPVYLVYALMSRLDEDANFVSDWMLREDGSHPVKTMFPQVTPAVETAPLPVNANDKNIAMATVTLDPLDGMT